MIRGVHTMLYSSEEAALRAFLRDKLGFDSFTDVGGGWLIFNVPEADMGCHPAGDSPTDKSGTHDISFYCDDIHRTVAELKERGVEFTQEIDEQEWGFITRFKVPGDFTMQLYQPRYAKS